MKFFDAVRESVSGWVSGNIHALTHVGDIWNAASSGNFGEALGHSPWGLFVQGSAVNQELCKKHPEYKVCKNAPITASQASTALNSLQSFAGGVGHPVKGNFTIPGRTGGVKPASQSGVTVAGKPAGGPGLFLILGAVAAIFSILKTLKILK